MELGLRLHEIVQLGYCGVDGVQGSAGAASRLVGRLGRRSTARKGERTGMTRDAKSFSELLNQWKHLRLRWDINQEVTT